MGSRGPSDCCTIAADQLTPAAKLQVQQLLGTDDAATVMMDVSTWADEIRLQRPNTAPWHFVNIPVGAAGYNRARNCPHDDCVVAQIERDARIVDDRQLAAPIRAEALRFLIHLVGDLHQPLHAADNGDRGGNQVHVLSRRRNTNLHAVWDVERQTGSCCCRQYQLSRQAGGRATCIGCWIAFASLALGSKVGSWAAAMSFIGASSRSSMTW